MIRSKTLIWLLLALAPAAWAGCTKSDPPRESAVVLTFCTGHPETRAGDGNVADGGGIYVDGSGNPDLFIAVVNYSGTVVATYCGANTEDAERLENSTATRTSIRFKNISSSGNYTVYAVANTAGGVWGAPGNSSAWGAYTTATALDNLTFAQLQNDALPTVTDRMPLSAKGTLYVNEGLNGLIELELLRCVAKVGFKFKNETGEDLTLTSCTVTLKDINPDQGYLFQKEPDVTGNIRDLELINSTLSVPRNVTTALYGDLPVFPSTAPQRAVGSRYFCNISFTISGTPKTFNDLPIHDRQSHDIPALGRNQYLQIETRINRGLDVSFNFIVHDWDENTEEILFH